MEIVSGDSRIFSGESVRLKCSVPDIRSTWDYMWFRGSEQLPQTGETFSLWKANVKESGKFYCQGVRNTVVGKIHTLQSLPLEINVDGKIFVCLFISIIRNLLDSRQDQFSLFFVLLLLLKFGNHGTLATLNFF